MAEVLTPMSSTSTITMLHTRPSSAEAFQDSVPQSPRLGQQPRSMFGQGQTSSYRTSTPVQPYAFQSTPHLRHDARSVSTQSTIAPPQPSNHGASLSVSSGSSDNSSKDDSVIGSKVGSMINLSSAIPDLSLINPDQKAYKASPDRYRRPAQRRNDSSKDVVPQQTTTTRPVSGVLRQPSVDDMAVRSPSESAKRYRRRSLNSLDTTNILSQGDAQIVAKLQRPASSGPGMSATSTPTAINPTVFHRHSNSQAASVETEPTPAEAKVVAVPPRSSSSTTVETHKRPTAPSPLSQSAVDPDSPITSPVKARTYAAVAQAAVKTPSPAAQHLAAVSDKDLNKGMKSRLRRAFSFGSSQELRRASAQNNLPSTQPGHPDDDLDPEQQEIARRQEAAGIGAGIYSGQGGYTGSTDNISISSTASSASLMLRKMGQSAKKGARSIKGLFRPKSVIGVPAADGPIQPQPSQIVQPSVAQVTMVTVEAERQRVNVNADPADREAGATGFPKLENNSIETSLLPQVRASADGDSTSSRKSIVGIDRDRAEVLAAVTKGILKRSATDSPVSAAHINDSPAPSMPGTPKDRIGAINNDYFSPRLGVQVTKSTPNTPSAGLRISFSPRIQFHDAWSATEYDRRGEIATCNRLTPMLAQQIKEELNTFKMEMEVHEASKPHTHFF